MTREESEEFLKANPQFRLPDEWVRDFEKSVDEDRVYPRFTPKGLDVARMRIKRQQIEQKKGRNR